MENLFNKVLGIIKAFVTSKIGAIVVLAVAAVAVVSAFCGAFALIGFVLGLAALATAIYLRATGTKNDFTAIATVVAAVAVILTAVMFSLDNTAAAEAEKNYIYQYRNDNYEARSIQNAELNGEIEKYNGDHKLKESVIKKVQKKVKKIEKKYSKDSSDDDDE
ncbi:MAG: hypothetical protein K6B17_02335 [Treponema sp.]|nr:hypothetical protein [Treponema sp.]